VIDPESLRLGFAFSLGMGTFLAPCAFPLLPGYVAFYVGSGDGGGGPASANDVGGGEGPTGAEATAADGGPATARARGGSATARAGDVATTAGGRRALLGRLRRAVTVGLVTSLGFFAVYAVLAAVVFALGSSVLRNVSVLELVVGTIMVVLGTAMASGRVDLTAVHLPLPERRRGPLGYFAFGVVYAAAAAGCTAGLFVGLSSLALSSGPTGAVAVFAAYAAGMSVLMIGVTVAAALGRQALVRTLSANTRLVSRAAGVVLAVAGLVQLYYFLFRFDGLRLLLG
jgi:cytochrome c-type biogenesis protein